MTPNDTETVHLKYSPKENITFEDSVLLFPAGFEKIFLILYIVALPYITGLMFLFFYISEAKSELFFAISDNASFLLTWAIGYEIFVGIVLLYLIYNTIIVTLTNTNTKPLQRL